MSTQRPSGKKLGFAGMNSEKQREIASKGGKAAWMAGTAHRWSSEEAVAAGKIGGAKSKRRKKGALLADRS